MKPESLIEILKNKCIGLQAKMDVVKGQGNVELYEVFNNELEDTQISIDHLKKASEGIKYTSNNTIKDKMKQYLLEETPNLSWYFRKKSINEALTKAVNNAFERMSDENLKNKLVSIVE
jgi:hypothetical protein